MKASAYIFVLVWFCLINFDVRANSDRLCTDDIFEPPVVRQGLSDLKPSTVRMTMMPYQTVGAPSVFVATIIGNKHAIVEVGGMNYSCQHRVSLQECPVLGEILSELRDIKVWVSRDYDPNNEAISWNATQYRLEIRGAGGDSVALIIHSGEDENPIGDFLVGSRDRLMSCLPPEMIDYVGLKRGGK